MSTHSALLLSGICLLRVLTSILVCGALAVAGATMQTVFRNPLAEPGITGVSSGAAVITAGRQLKMLDLGDDPDLVLTTARHAGERTAADQLADAGVDALTLTSDDFATPEACAAALVCVAETLGEEESAAVRAGAFDAAADAGIRGTAPSTQRCS